MRPFHSCLLAEDIPGPRPSPRSGSCVPVLDKLCDLTAAISGGAQGLALRSLCLYGDDGALDLWEQSTLRKELHGSSGSSLGRKRWLSTQYFYLFDSFLLGLIRLPTRWMMLCLDPNRAVSFQAP